MDRYHWPAEEERQVWRHITNYRLTCSAGNLHSLEIALLDGTYMLWGELLPAPSQQHAHIPAIPIPIPIPVVAKVVTHSIDIGRHMGDPDRGLWLQDLSGFWYKLGAPAQTFQRFAKPLQYKAEQFLQLCDALLFQNLATSQFLSSKARYGCALDIYAVHRASKPAFDLQFVKVNKEFVLQHLAALFDADAASVLFNSITQMDAPPSPKQTALQRELLKLRASGVLSINSATVHDASSDMSISEVEGEMKRTSSIQKQLPVGTVTPETRRKLAITPSKKKIGDSSPPKKAKPIAKRPRIVLSTSSSSSSFPLSEQEHEDGPSAHSDHIGSLLPKLSSLVVRKPARTAGAGMGPDAAGSARTRKQNGKQGKINGKNTVTTRSSAALVGEEFSQLTGPPPPPAEDLVSEQQLQWWREVRGWWQQQNHQNEVSRPPPHLTLPLPAPAGTEVMKLTLADAYDAAPSLPPAHPTSAATKKKRSRFDDTPDPDPAPAALPTLLHSQLQPKHSSSVAYPTNNTPSQASNPSSSPVLGEGALRDVPMSGSCTVGAGRGRSATLPAWLTSTSTGVVSSCTEHLSVASPSECIAHLAYAATSPVARQGNEGLHADLHRRSRDSCGGAGRGRNATLPAWVTSNDAGGASALKIQLSKIHGTRAVLAPPDILPCPEGLEGAINHTSTAKETNGCVVNMSAIRRTAKSRAWLDDVDGSLPAPSPSLGSSTPASTLSQQQANVSDKCLGVDSAKANLDAVDALLNSLSTPSQQTASAAASSSSSEGLPTHIAAATVTTESQSPTTATSSERRDDKYVEKERYVRKHHCGQQQEGAPQPRAGWGGLLGLVKLGAREDDPKKRMELTTQSALGAFASANVHVGRYIPPDRTVRPCKSSLRGLLPRTVRSSCSASSMEEGQLVPESCGSFSPISVKWQDMKEGSQLYTRHSYSAAGSDSDAEVL